MIGTDYRRTWKKFDPRKYEEQVEKKYADHPRLYIGYGSNLNIPQMMGRCETAEKVRAVNLLNYKLVFTDVATVEPCPGVKVPCGLWRVQPMDIDALDIYEGYPGLYTKVYATINLEGADELAFLYVLDIDYELSTPGSNYLRTCLDGYRQWGLNEEVLRVAEAEAEDYEHDQAVTPRACGACDEVLPGSMLIYTRHYGLLCDDCYEILLPSKDVKVDPYWNNTVGETRTSLLYDDMHPDWTNDDKELDYRPPEDRGGTKTHQYLDEEGNILDWTPGGNYAPNVYDDMYTRDDLGSNSYGTYGGGWCG